MKPVLLPVRAALLAAIVSTLWCAATVRLPSAVNLCIITGGVLLTFLVVWIASGVLDRHQTERAAVRITTMVHVALGFTLGVPLVRATVTQRDWSGWILPIPRPVGFALVVVTGTASLFTIISLALKGLGAPFFIALSRRLTADWCYARTRNPMALAGLAFVCSLGIWFQSSLFVLWVLVLLAPALLTFIKVYEERELTLRFGDPYRQYRARTPFLWPILRRPAPPS